MSYGSFIENLLDNLFSIFTSSEPVLFLSRKLIFKYIPPLVFGEDDADLLVIILDKVFQEDAIISVTPS
jgi:hypothetical protein